MYKDSLRGYDFTFQFMATNFSGLGNGNETRPQSISVRACDFDEAIVQLKQKLSNFRSNSFSKFMVETDQSIGGAHIGFRTVLVNPDPLPNTENILNCALFALGE